MGAVTPAEAVEATDAARRELASYEGLRAGRREAFAALATELDPVLFDLALAGGAGAGAARSLVRHTWAVALPGLDLFAWRSSLRAWVAGVLVGLALPAAGPRGEPAVRASPRRVPAGPHDWSDLPWGARWSDGSWEAVARARAGLPVDEHRALLLADVHLWSPRDAADALGLTASRHARTLGAARLALHDALEALVIPDPAATRAGCGHDRAALLGHLARDGRPPEGTPQGPPCSHCRALASRWRHVGALLASTAAAPPARPDPEVMALYRRWRAARRGGLAAWLSRRRPVDARRPPDARWRL